MHPRDNSPPRVVTPAQPNAPKMTLWLALTCGAICLLTFSLL